MRMFSLCMLMTTAIYVQAMESGINFVFRSKPEVTITYYNPAARRIQALLKEGDYTETIDIQGKSSGYVSYRENCLDQRQLVEYGSAAHSLFNKLVDVHTQQQEKWPCCKQHKQHKHLPNKKQLKENLHHFPNYNNIVFQGLIRIKRQRIYKPILCLLVFCVG